MRNDPAGGTDRSDAPASPADIPTLAPQGDANPTVDYAVGPDSSPRWAGNLPDQLPAQFGRYRLTKLLGKGGMGAVYHGHDPQLDRAVAVKIPLFAGGDAGETKERFFREARAAAAISHPNLCPVFDVGELGGVLYLTMAFIEGQPLTSLIRGGGTVPLRRAALLVRQLALALQEAHDHGIIHRDLKPANVMLNRKGQPVIMDFGLARRTLRPDDARLTQSGAILGTPAYMPPEQVNGDLKAMGPGCDIYSLGVILYELITGRLPFGGPFGTLMASILHDEPPPPSRFRPDLDCGLEAICLKALAKQPGDRHPSMKAFARALEGYLAGEPAAPPELNVLEVVAASPEGADPDAAAAPARKARTVKASPAPRPAVKKGGWLGLLAGCFIVLVLAGGLLVGGVYYAAKTFTPDISGWVKKEMAQHHQWDDIAGFWRAPPADISAEQLFPEQVNGYQLQSHDDKADIAEFGLKKAGRRAVYRSGVGDIELFVWRATELEKEMMLTKVEKVTKPGEDGKSSHGAASFRGSAEGRYITYRLGGAFGEPLNAGTFWWDKDWLFLARSTQVDDPGGLLKEYLKIVSNFDSPAKK
jgi:hypothetical protein